MSRSRIIVVASVTLLIVVAAAVGIYFANHDKTEIQPVQTSAQPIPNGVYFAQVRKLSQGKKPQCLSDDATAEAAVKAIPVVKDYSDTFDGVLGTQIIDMPAGMYDNKVHSFDGHQATGTVSFTDKNQQAVVGSLRSFNYIAKVDSMNVWKPALLIACQE